MEAPDLVCKLNKRLNGLKQAPTLRRLIGLTTLPLRSSKLEIFACSLRT